MQKPPQRSTAEILDVYRDYLLSKVSKVHILGDADERELKDVFVELSITHQHAPRQHSKFLGMMDSVMRRRFNPFGNAEAGVRFRAAREALIRRRFDSFADADRDTSPQILGHREEEFKRLVKSDELLRRRTKAIVTGAPGCGKTTLFKYLALQAQEKEKRLAVWLELKVINQSLLASAESGAAYNGSLILQELWLKHLKTQLSLSEAEAKLLHKHWQEKFKANEITVLLDGFDELQDEAAERSLNKCVREFASALHDNTLLISTRPYAQHKLGKERLQELEIEPLNQRQIGAFLDCYYPNDAATKGLLKNLRDRSSLKDLLHVPLLLGVILRLHRENRFTNERLKLYEMIIIDLAHELDRSKSVVGRFKINDERLRLDFLKFFAFERLLRDTLDEEEQEANRIIFSYDLLRQKAQMFLHQERSSYNPRDLADDTLATPLLREVGPGLFAFTHLTLQEYLAARAFAAFYRDHEFEALKIFCRAYYNRTIVEMEVLPMMLGATPYADQLYDEMKHWPESLTFANLRLCARGLAYSANIKHDRRSDLIDRFLALLSGNLREHTPYLKIVIDSFAGVNHQTMSLLETKAAPLIETGYSYSLWVAEALGRVGSEKAVEALTSALNDKEWYVRSSVVRALGRVGSERVVDVLLVALNDMDGRVRLDAVNALGRIGSEKAVKALTSILYYESRYLCEAAAEALGQIGSEEAIDHLVSVLWDEDWYIRSRVALALGQFCSERVVDVLLLALNDERSGVRSSAADALGRIGSEQAIGPLSHALNDKGSHVRASAVRALARIGHEKVTNALISALKDECSSVRSSAARALTEIDSEKAIQALTSLLHRSDRYLRSSAAELLEMIGLEKVIYVLACAMNDSDAKVRSNAAELLRELGSEETVESLLSALNHSDSDVRSSAAGLLRGLDSEEVVGDLIFALNDADWRVRWEVAEALTQIKAEALISGLGQTLQQHNSFVRKKAVSVIGYYSDDARTLDQLKVLAQLDMSPSFRRAATDEARKFARKLELLGHFITTGTVQPLSDNESRELFLVGEAFRVAAEAGHIFRPTPNSDWGIDGEIEFKNRHGEASGQRVYLQLKSGDSYLRKRKMDGKEIFTIKNSRHAAYWQSHAYPVLLVIRDPNGLIRWMDVSEYLQRRGTNIRQIEFQGEPFTAESVRQMRDRLAR